MHIVCVYMHIGHTHLIIGSEEHLNCIVIREERVRDDSP